jgi:hypothetical protein
MVSPIIQPTFEQWEALEEFYSAALYNGNGPAGSTRVIGNLSGKFVFTAPHAVNHIREGAVKYADRGTGGLAELIALSSGNTAFTVAGQLDHDPNWDQQSPFKSELLSLLRQGQLIIDLHGMKDSYNIDINIGLGPAAGSTSKHLAGKLKVAFDSSEFITSVDWPFDGRRPGTVTTFIQANGFSGVQIEIASKLRYPNINPSDVARLSECFLSVVNTY